MTSFRANAKLVKDHRIDVDDGRSHAICLDLPLDIGTDLGTSALELALMSFAGCYATIFILTADKMRIHIKDLEVAIDAIKTEEAGTLTEAKADIIIKTDGPIDRIERIHKLTAKTCPVGIIFEKAGVKTTYNVRIEKEKHISSPS